MGSKSKFENGKAQSLVFAFAEELDKDGSEPDFLKWLEMPLMMDIAIAGDGAAYDKLSKEEREAWKLFHDAIQAGGSLLHLYKENLPLFQKVAGQLTLLPAFLSLHPDNLRFNRKLLEKSRLSRSNMPSIYQPKGRHLASQSSPVRYAYAIIFTIDLTMDTYETRLPEWAKTYGYGVKHPIPMSRYEEAARKLGWDEERKRLELPSYVGSFKILPAWTRTLQNLRRPLNPAHVLDYWRTGKAMILEEMPDFQLRPEWTRYEKRHYKTGSKTGAVQHAIFRDILAALRTIAGFNHRRNDSKQVTK